jgi:hypothetical protein
MLRKAALKNQISHVLAHLWNLDLKDDDNDNNNGTQMCMRITGIGESVEGGRRRKGNDTEG